MRFLSVCSGIEAASVACKTCAKCAAEKSLNDFHKQPTGPLGRHSWCKPCANAAQKASREKNVRPKAKREWNLSARYGLTPADVDAMLVKQVGVCAICAETLKKFHIDHCHSTGKVRGLLCHKCNIALGHVERPGFVAAALSYLEAHK